jgi:hypothetical protein
MTEGRGQMTEGVRRRERMADRLGEMLGILNRDEI